MGAVFPPEAGRTGVSLFMGQWLKGFKGIQKQCVRLAFPRAQGKEWLSAPASMSRSEMRRDMAAPSFSIVWKKDSCSAGEAFWQAEAAERITERGVRSSWRNCRHKTGSGCLCFCSGTRSLPVKSRQKESGPGEEKATSIKSMPLRLYLFLQWGQGFQNQYRQLPRIPGG